MRTKRIDEKMLQAYVQYLRKEERSELTIQKYLRDLRRFAEAVPCERAPKKEDVLEFKNELIKKFAASTVNSMLAALNGFFAFMGWHELRVKPIKIQRRIFCSRSKELTREEYIRLLKTAPSGGRLYWILQTICATGIRVSELRYITVESLQTGISEVDCKQKHRVILIPLKLRKGLLTYCRQRGIEHGAVFITRSGRPVDRSNIWHEMKALCASARVEASKVFPHNLRHLFAKTFYRKEKDIAKLADVLGHSSIETTRLYIMESGYEHEKIVSNLGLLI